MNETKIILAIIAEKYWNDSTNNYEIKSLIKSEDVRNKNSLLFIVDKIKSILRKK